MEDIIMIGKFVVWFIVYGLSFLVSNVLGWVEQGIAFFYIYLGFLILYGICIIILLVHGKHVNLAPCEMERLFDTIPKMLITLVINLLVTFVITKLFNVNFYVVYQIILFCQCLVPNIKKNN